MIMRLSTRWIARILLGCSFIFLYILLRKDLPLPSVDLLPQTRTTTTTTRAAPVVAHVVSLIHCDQDARTAGFLDALLIFRHSIHQHSIRTTTASSRYDYQMIALVTGSCDVHRRAIQARGYQVRRIANNHPVNVSRIENDWYREHVKYENCCGADEFIKLVAYTLTAFPVVVHWDLDVLLLRPLDDVYDAIRFDASSDIGKAARSRLHVQHPELQPLPYTIDAFFTRDVTSAKPWEDIRAVQGGFVVVRPDTRDFERMIEIIHRGDYSPGRGPGSGWGSRGYGGFQGAMAYQGILAYYYDQITPNRAVELDVCRYNQVVADVIWRGPEGPEYNGTCREKAPAGRDFRDHTPENGHCQDCRTLDVAETYSVHYTACKKPWECRLPHPRIPGPRRKAHTYRLQQLTNVTTCGALFRRYFETRKEAETLLHQYGRMDVPTTTTENSFHPDYFLGYCQKDGHYIPMGPVKGPLEPLYSV